MKFRIYITFDTGDRHLDTDWCDKETLLNSIGRLRHGPISKMGVLKEIRVIDEDDYTIFLVQDDKVVFPQINEDVAC
jgi:hypothetical protein